MESGAATKRIASQAKASQSKKSGLLPLIEYELRTILNAFVGTAQVMTKQLNKSLQKQEELRPEEWKTYIENLTTANQDFSHLLEQLLDYIRLQQGQLQVENHALDFTELFQPIAHAFAIKAKEKNLQFVVRYPEQSAPVVYGDAMRIRQIIYNLLENALKFTVSGEIQLSVNTTANNNAVEVKVSDTGIGIAQEKLSQVFDDFTQLYDNSGYSKNYQGLGIGLTLVRYLVEAQGGIIQIESTLGQGTSVRFTLPTTSKVKKSIQQHLAGKRLLFVEQNSHNRLDLLQQLAQAGAIYQQTSLNEASYLLCQEDSEIRPDIVTVMADVLDQRVTYFARVLRANRHYQDILLMLILPKTKNYRYEKEQALIHGYNEVIGMMQPSLLVETLTTCWDDWQNKGAATVVVKPLANISKVLVIEDNEINQKVIRLLLNELGFNVEVAANGENGLTAIEQNSYSAVFVDIGLPDISGLDVISELRERNDEKAHIPVIVLSADGTLSDERSFRQRGIDAYLVKPLTLEQLRQTLEPFFEFKGADK